VNYTVHQYMAVIRAADSLSVDACCRELELHERLLLFPLSK